MTLVLTSVELTLLCSLLKELIVDRVCVVMLFAHNISVKHLTTNLVMHAHMKHVKIYFSFYLRFGSTMIIRLYVRYTLTEDQVTDAFIKPIPKHHFNSLRIKLMVVFQS